MIEYPKYKKVLFCTDFSENADYAFDFAYGIAKRDEGLLYILHVIPYDPHQSYAEKYIGNKNLEKLQKGIVEDLNNNYREHYLGKIKNGIPCEIVTRSGREDEEILTFAKQEHVDIIVMGTHGRTGIEHVFFGSVSEKVLRHSPFPVFVIPCKKKLNGYKPVYEKGGIPMKKNKALVIDDEQIVLDSISQILTDENYEVDVSLSGREGLNQAIEKDYDIVLTDIRMPDIGGMRVLRDVKRAKPSLPVVIITGYASVKSAVQAMKLGAADYIEKPFEPEDLLKAVSSVLGIAATQTPEVQDLIHKEEMIKVLERAATDSEFFTNLLEYATDALDDYDLTGPEKLALLTGDVEWIEEAIGPLTRSQRRWLDLRRSAEIW
jgi:FixJ family two-component response regulator/nucleotide-binding universal stress UspA family protein